MYVRSFVRSFVRSYVRKTHAVIARAMPMVPKVLWCHKEKNDTKINTYFTVCNIHILWKYISREYTRSNLKKNRRVRKKNLFDLNSTPQIYAYFFKVACFRSFLIRFGWSFFYFYAKISQKCEYDNFEERGSKFEYQKSCFLTVLDYLFRFLYK